MPLKPTIFENSNVNQLQTILQSCFDNSMSLNLFTFTSNKDQIIKKLRKSKSKDTYGIFFTQKNENYFLTNTISSKKVNFNPLSLYVFTEKKILQELQNAKLKKPNSIITVTEFSNSELTILRENAPFTSQKIFSFAEQFDTFEAVYEPIQLAYMFSAILQDNQTIIVEV